MRLRIGLVGLGLAGLAGCANDATSGGGPGPSMVDPTTGNHYPQVLDFSCSPEAGDAPLLTTCTWSISDDDGDGMKCVLDVGIDGTLEAEFAQCPSGAELKIATVGTVPIRLFVTDLKGGPGSKDTAVTVTQPPNQAPRVDSLAVNPPMGGQPLNATFTYAVSDPDGDQLHCRLLDQDQVVVAPHPCGPSNTQSAVFAAVGSHPVTLEVTDDKGGRATQSVTVVVTALPQVGDLRISKIEWGQTVISANPRLVAGKDALLRVYILSEKPGVASVKAQVEGFNGGGSLGVLALNGPSVAPTAETQGDMSLQWRATVPAAWVSQGLSLKLTVDPANLLGETNEQNNELTVTPTVGAGNVLPVTHVPIVQSGRTGTVRNIETAMKQIWPLKAVDQKTRAAYSFNGTIAANGGGWSTLLDDLLQVKQSDGSRRSYLGWISVTFGSGVAGLGYVGIGSALTRDDEISTSVHELGHNMGREHAPCGGAGGADPYYPVAQAHLDAPGFDLASQRMLPAGQYYDVMSYCEPIWVSAYNYRAVQQWLEAHPVSPTAPGAPVPRLVVSGQLRQGQLTLRPLTLIEARGEAELPEPGEYSLTLKGAQAVSIPFTVHRVADGPDEAHFAFLAPAVPGLYAAQVSYRGATVATAVAGPPQGKQQVKVTEAAGGVVLEWNPAAFPYAALAHLGPDERTTLTVGATGGKAFVSTAGLAEGGTFEVSLSDGVQSQRLVLAR